MTASRPDDVEIRPATGDDAGAVADVFLAAYHSTYDFPLAHTDDEVREWIRSQLIPAGRTWVATRDGRVVAMMSLGDGWLEQLYVDPGEHGRGIGSRLVARAKAEEPTGLELYTFQVNGRARRFYERRGFEVVELGDGAGNEEGQPDVRYRWQPHAPSGDREA